MYLHMPADSKDLIFKKIITLLRKHRKGLDLREEVFRTQAKNKKPAMHLYGKEAVQIGNRPKQPTYVVGTVMQKHFVSLYSMGVYADPSLMFTHPLLKKAMKGKGCFNLTVLDAAMEKEIDRHIAKTISMFRKKGWV